MNGNELSDSGVFIAEGIPGYPADELFGPSISYPEYPFGQEGLGPSAPCNGVYDAVRQLLRSMHMDARRFGTREWNPFCASVRRGGTVVVKPSWVWHYETGAGLDGPLGVIITHTSLLRALIDYVSIAVGPSGRVVVADSPIQSTDIGSILRNAGVDRLAQFYQGRGVPLEIVDLRAYVTIVDSMGRIVRRQSLQSDPAGCQTIDLKFDSALTPLDQTSTVRYRAPDHDSTLTSSSHGRGMHVYSIPKTILGADLIINVPKLKTHRRAGLTAAMKNLVGMNSEKALLPHFRAGPPDTGGDEYSAPNLVLWLRSRLKGRIDFLPNPILSAARTSARWIAGAARLVRKSKSMDPYATCGGAWYGNDTLWRMIVDLNYLLMHTDQTGRLCPEPQRRWLSIVDAVVAGQGDGPLSPDPLPLGKLIAGWNEVEVDATCARLLGLDWRKLKYLAEGYPRLFERSDLDELTVQTSQGKLLALKELAPGSCSVPEGWAGHVELTTTRTPGTQSKQ